jgi:glucose/mannose-6-phosphate isomerase
VPRHDIRYLFNVFLLIIFAAYLFSQYNGYSMSMDKMIEAFPIQLKEAIKLANNISVTDHHTSLNKVMVLGMGGSGIGGDFVRSIVSNVCKYPIVVNKSYDIPAWVDQHTLVITSSYSGNTEETISAFESALTTGAKITIISSGGKLIDKAKALKLDHVLLPGGWPSPRACLGYSIVAQLGILIKTGIVLPVYLEHVKSAIDLMKFDQDGIKKQAFDIASWLFKKTPVIYTPDSMEPVAIRWRQQINENSKMLSWHHVVPEMNHNELVGWKSQRKDIAVVVLRNRDDHKRTSHRMDICKKLIEPLSGGYLEVMSKGNSILEKSFYLVHLGDWVSLYLAQMNKVDPVEIDVIDALKNKLGKL